MLPPYLQPVEGVDPPDNDVSAAFLSSPPFIEHGKRLPYAWSCAKI